MKSLKIKYSKDSVIRGCQYATIMNFTNTVLDDELQLSDIQAEFLESCIEDFAMFSS